MCCYVIVFFFCGRGNDCSCVAFRRRTHSILNVAKSGFSESFNDFWIKRAIKKIKAQFFYLSVHLNSLERGMVEVDLNSVYANVWQRLHATNSMHKYSAAVFTYSIVSPIQKLNYKHYRCTSVARNGLEWQVFGLVWFLGLENSVLGAQCASAFIINNSTCVWIKFVR